MLRKKDVKKGTHYIYTIYDCISKKYRGTFYHTTDEDMIRTSLPSVLMDFPLRDIEIYRIAIFNEDTGEIFECRKVLIPTDCYTFPHDRCSPDGEDLPLEEIDSAMKEHKAKLVASLSDNKSKQKEGKKK